MYEINNSYFKQDMIKDRIYLPRNMPDIESVESILADYEIISIEEINTPIGLSCEGENLTGKKISIRIKLTRRITYVTCDKDQSRHSFFFNSYHNKCIVVPYLIDGYRPRVLIKDNLLNAKMLIESINYTKIDEREVFNSIYIYIYIYAIPTYKLCYTLDNGCMKSSLHINYEDCSNEKRLVYFDNYNIQHIKWSFDGNKIAFVASDQFGSYLFVLYVKSCTTQQITYIYDFNQIIDFNWSKSSDEIIFTGYKSNKKNIYKVNIFSCKYINLTYSYEKVYSLKPKYSLDFKFLSFVKGFKNNRDIYLKNNHNSNEIQLTRNEKVVDYDWISKYEIVYISYLNGLFILNYLNTCVKKPHILKILGKDIHYSRIKSSRDNKYISLIGAYQNIENIYIFSISENKLKNVTDYKEITKINDFDWNSDSSKIIFSSNQLGYYNLYSISINTEEIKLLKGNSVNNIFISFKDNPDFYE